MNIDIERLRKDLMDECTGAYFAGGFGGTIIEILDIQSATDEEIIRIAIDKGIELNNYVLL